MVTQVEGTPTGRHRHELDGPEDPAELDVSDDHPTIPSRTLTTVGPGPRGWTPPPAHAGHRYVLHILRCTGSRDSDLPAVDPFGRRVYGLSTRVRDLFQL